MALRLALLCAAAAAAGHVGEWRAPPSALPNLQLPHVPLTGNGHLGAALDASSTARNASASGPGRLNTLDAWLATTSLWSCMACSAGDDPDRDVPACCSTIALGGASASFLPTFPSPLPAFYAAQDTASGELRASYSTPGSGAINASVRIHPVLDVAVLNVSYAPGPSDPAVLDFALSLWVLGNGAIAGSWSTGLPAPLRVGCAGWDGAEQPTCAAPASGAPSPLLFASRAAATRDASYPLSAALAGGLLLSPSAVHRGSAITGAPTPPGAPPSRPWEATFQLRLPAGAWAALALGEAECSGAANATDPVPAALALAASAAAAAQAGAVAAAADAWWAQFWAQSSISLPSQPLVEAMWVGAQYILGAGSSASELAPAPGLYGPWVTADGPNWHGDYTLDYNYNAPYFGAFAANHAAQTAPFWAPIMQHMPAARRKAQVQAGLARVTCPASALYYGCHLAPWGLGSLDTMGRYMSWNGPYAALLFVNAWEYTRDERFARAATLPLLAGLNDWWLCYLSRAANGTFSDDNAFNPDMEHEGQPVPNPQIALALLHRTVLAQVDIEAQLGLATLPALLQLAAHLPPFNTAPAPVPGPANFSTLPNTRCSQDLATYYDVPSPAACAALCAANAACGLFSYCPPYAGGGAVGGCSGSAGEPRPNTCWGYPAARLLQCTHRPQDAGWTSGARLSAPPAYNVSVWSAFGGASVAASDSFATYPLWPAEALAPPLAPGFPGAGTPANAALRALAANSALQYSNFVSGRPVDLFPLAVRTGYLGAAGGAAAAAAAAAAAGAQAAPPPPRGNDPAAVLRGLNAYLRSYFGPNLLAYAPGGGIENTGISRAVSEMLLQGVRLAPAPGAPARARYAAHFFPFWPAQEPAAFQGLVAQGGLVCAGAYDNATAAVVSPVQVALVRAVGGGGGGEVGVLCPWGAGACSVACGGAPVGLAWEEGVLLFTAPVGVPCAVAKQ